MLVQVSLIDMTGGSALADNHIEPVTDSYIWITTTGSHDPLRFYIEEGQLIFKPDYYSIDSIVLPTLAEQLKAMTDAAGSEPARWYAEIKSYDSSGVRITDASVLQEGTLLLVRPSFYPNGAVELGSIEKMSLNV